jgi:hypothetical protein
MSENILSFGGSQQFRKKLVSRNLKPYKIDGAYSSHQDPINFETVLHDSSPTDSPNVSDTIFVEPTEMTTINIFGPSGKFIDGAQIIDNVTIPSYPKDYTGGQSEYSPKDTKMDLINEAFIDNVAVVNRYTPEENYSDLFIVTEKILPKTKLQSGVYPESFVQGDYTAYEILNNDPELGNDSYIQRIGAERLTEAFQARIAREIERNTIGLINLDALTNVFDATLVATGQEPLIQKNYTITVPNGIIDYAAFFIQRITGAYLPASPIEGSYFSLPQRQRMKPLQTLGNLGGNILNRQNPSVIFLNNTGSGQKSILFNTLSYNRYKPDYTLTRTQVGAFIENLFDNPSSIGNLYIGRQESDITRVSSPPNATPVNAFGIPMQTTVYGPDKVGTLYEGDQNFQFGLAGKSYSERPVFDGGFVWISNLTKVEAGRTVGQDGKIYGNNPQFTPLSSSYSQVLSTNYVFRPGSILDVTQRIIDSTPAQGKDRLGHVGNAMNQVSKVFWDGYKELTKGSKIKKYIDQAGQQVGTEYCRIFSKDRPYSTYGDLQGTYANTSGMDTNGNIRRYSYSVLDSAYNLNIVPYKDGGTSMLGGSVKKYMFSIENLAWKNSPEFESLPDCEKGPNGGRIMWFPPYDLTFDDSTSASFTETKFIGRPEPIYTYNNTSRSGSVGFKIIVDHPSVLNLIANKELENQNSEVVNGVVNSFFAGCKKYDIYELAKKFGQLDFNTISELYQEVLSSDGTSDEDKIDALQSLPSEGGNSIGTENISLSQSFNDWGFYFDFSDSPSENYTDLYNTYTSTLIRTNYSTLNPTENTSLIFDSVITENYNKMVSLRAEIATILQKGGGVEIVFQGTQGVNESPDSSIATNDSLLESIKLFFNDFSLGTDGKNLSYYESQTKLKYTILNSVIVDTIPQSSQSFESVNCSDGFNPESAILDYTRQAMLCRAIKIKNINLNQVSPTDESANVPNDSSPQSNTRRLNNSPGQFLADLFGNKKSNKESIEAKAKNISKKIIRNLLNEQNYFEILKEQDPFLYDSYKTKIKFFNPAFHSITPEGFNSRLTFLNQCFRPGNTIPTKNEGGEFIKKDSFNTNFGTPPILVLRIGDFYNCKIVPDGGLTLSYENLDINPEGIGVQPMIVTVKLTFKMIGGHGLKEPVERLQNALSFNYYANTEMYDERSVSTDTTQLTAIVDSTKSILTTLQTLQGIAAQPSNNLISSNQATIQNPTDGGVTIGLITESNQSNGSETGTISYKSFFDGNVDSTQSYFNLVESFIKSIISDTNYGVFKQLYSDRKFNNGSFNSLQSPINNVKIIGKFNDYSKYIDDVTSAYITEVENNTDFITQYLITNNVSANDLRIVTSNLKAKAQTQKNKILNLISNKSQSIAVSQSEIYQGYRKMDLICDATDGKLATYGTPIIYTNTGVIVGTSDTLTDIRNDYTKIANDINDYYSYLLSKNLILEITTPNVYFTPLTTLSSTGSINLFFTLFANDIINDTTRNEFIQYVSSNLLSQTLPQTVDKVSVAVNSVVSSFNTEKNAQNLLVNDTFNSNEYKFFKTYNPQVNNVSIKGRDRDFTFTSIGATNVQKTNLSDVYKNVNINNDNSTYNGKKYFN